jgi:hypothetical protein
MVDVALHAEVVTTSANDHREVIQLPDYGPTGATVGVQQTGLPTDRHLLLRPAGRGHHEVWTPGQRRPR